MGYIYINIYMIIMFELYQNIIGLRQKKPLGIQNRVWHEGYPSSHYGREAVKINKGYICINIYIMIMLGLYRIYDKRRVSDNLSWPCILKIKLGVRLPQYQQRKPDGYGWMYLINPQELIIWLYQPSKVQQNCAYISWDIMCIIWSCLRVWM